jgi:hypothetical protein
MFVGEEFLIWFNIKTILSIVVLTYLEGFVDSNETTSLGRLARNAPRQLMVRGTCHVSDVNLR